MKAMNIDWLSNCPACGHSQAMVKTEKGRQDWLYVWHKGRWPLVCSSSLEGGKPTELLLPSYIVSCLSPDIR